MMYFQPSADKTKTKNVVPQPSADKVPQPSADKDKDK